jgi:hypothetical protein
MHADPAIGWLIQVNTIAGEKSNRVTLVEV